MRLGSIRPPRLRTVETEAAERHATWMELFYDLVFVVGVANLAQRLLGNPDGDGILAFVGLFIPLWWAWAGYTFYADRFDTDDLGQRLLAVCQMVAIAMMAVSISGGVADSSVAFALSYVAARAVFLAMNYRARRHIAAVGPLLTGYLQGHSIAAGIWLISVFVPTPGRFILWAIGLAVDFATPYRLRKIQAKVPLDVSHLPERFGLFTILVLGESISAVVAGLALKGWKTSYTIHAMIGVVIAAGLWWIYFDNLEGSVVRRRPEQRTAWKPTVWIYSHLPLAGALTATAIGLEFVVKGSLTTSQRWILCGGMAVALVAMALIHISTEAGPERRDPVKARVRLGSAAVVVLIGLIGGSLPATALGLLLLVVVAGQVAVDLWVVESTASSGAELEVDSGVDEV